MGNCGVCGHELDGPIHLKSTTHLEGCPWTYPRGPQANFADLMWMRGQYDAKNGRKKAMKNSSYNLGFSLYMKTGELSALAVFAPSSNRRARFGYKP